MAFIPQASFLPRAGWRGRSTNPVQRAAPGRCTTPPSRRACILMQVKVRSSDAMEFFQHREGEWESWRVTHHLAFRRSESGESRITMQCLPSDDERIVGLCNDWQVDPDRAQGGCYVTWQATMAWDQEGENHEGSTVFALVPDEDDVRKGKILRDRGYAEIVPIAGTFYLDDEDHLNLDTPYDGGAVEEQFAFDGPDVVNRTSTVRRFGGFSTATFATERRVDSAAVDGNEDNLTFEEVEDLFEELSLFGGIKRADVVGEKEKSSLIGANRWGNPSPTAKPPATSAFGSGFSTPVAVTTAKDDGVKSKAERAAEKAGIDLSKIPPSMRDDFVASFDSEK